MTSTLLCLRDRIAPVGQRRRRRAGGRRPAIPALRSLPTRSRTSLPHQLFVYYDIRVARVGINVSARRHGVVDDDIDPEPPVRRLHLGPDRSGNMLEVVTLHFDDGGVLAIHAMKMTKQYWRLLKGHHND